MTAQRPIFNLRTAGPRRRHIGLAVMIALAFLWLGAASRVHVNASWSDEAWGYAAFPLFGQDPKIGDRVLFDPPDSLRSPVPYLKTVRGVPGMRIAIGIDGTAFLDGEPVGRAKAHALDGRPLEAIAPGTIPPGQFFLHADHADSHDSRYAEIGLVPASESSGAPSPCPTCRGSVWRGRWSDRRTPVALTARPRFYRIRRTDRPRKKTTRCPIRRRRPGHERA